MKKAILTYIFAFFGIGIVLVGGVGCPKEVGRANDNKKVYKIGEMGAGGGIVFYVSEEGFKVYDGEGGEETCHYLEMSEATLLESKWFPSYDMIGTKTGLGYGKENTYKILHAKSESLTEVNCAAYRCNKYSTANTKAGEWWLPSKDELDLIWQNQKDVVVKSCNSPWHWSSSEHNEGNAWEQNFNDGKQGESSKDRNINSVRAVRAF